MTTFKELNFKKHPLAPCVVLMYEVIHGKPEQLSGAICVETDDLLGGGNMPGITKDGSADGCYSKEFCDQLLDQVSPLASNGGRIEGASGKLERGERHNE